MQSRTEYQAWTEDNILDPGSVMLLIGIYNNKISRTISLSLTSQDTVVKINH